FANEWNAKPERSIEFPTSVLGKALSFFHSGNRLVDAQQDSSDLATGGPPDAADRGMAMCFGKGIRRRVGAPRGTGKCRRTRQSGRSRSKSARPLPLRARRRSIHRRDGSRKGFDFEKALGSDLALELAAVHGHGIQMVKAYMDDVHFERGGSEAHMRKCSRTTLRAGRARIGQDHEIETANQFVVEATPPLGRSESWECCESRSPKHFPNKGGRLKADSF